MKKQNFLICNRDGKQTYIRDTYENILKNIKDLLWIEPMVKKRGGKRNV